MATSSLKSIPPLNRMQVDKERKWTNDQLFWTKLSCKYNYIFNRKFSNIKYILLYGIKTLIKKLILQYKVFPVQMFK